MSEPVDPQYPQHPQSPAPGPVRVGLVERIGHRAFVRPLPRQGVSLAGAGVGLVVVGIVAWGGDFIAGGSSDARQLLGAFLALVAVVGGYLIAIRYGRGPLATAGVAASALGVPVLLAFLTFDRGSSGTPFSLDAVVLVSVAAWLVSYVAVRGTRGHALYLGLAAIALWLYLLDKAEPGSVGAAPVFGVFLRSDSEGSSGPDWTTVAILSLVFGVAYYAAAFVLDRRGHAGLAVPLVVAGLVPTAAGLAAASINLHEVGTGILLILFGLALGRYGALAGRRFTTWTWSVGVAFGIGLIVGKAAGDNAAAGGVALILSGCLLVVFGHLLTQTLREPDDVATLPGSGVGTEALP